MLIRFPTRSVTELSNLFHLRVVFCCCFFNGVSRQVGLSIALDSAPGNVIQQV